MKKDKKETVEKVAEIQEEPQEEVAEIQEHNFEEELQKLKEDYLRALADGENLKKRCAAEIEKNSKFAISSFAKELLSVADNLQRAVDAVSDAEAANCQSLLEGVKMTQAELMKVFNKFGITKMEIMGKVFDPNFHQVISEIEDKDKPHGTIIAEAQTGYMINDRILREANVVVTK